LYQTPSGFRTIGGGGGRSQSRSHRGPPTANPISANLSFNDSEERIVNDDHHMKAFSAQDNPPNGIVVSNVVELTHETVHDDKKSQTSDRKHDAREMW
jgi:hypothetical protein